MYNIIGAGPAGLYTALSLAKAGVDVKNIIIYDPRAGQYTRPGHLVGKVFRKTEQSLDIKFDNNIFYQGMRSQEEKLNRQKVNEHAHIKNFERTLYSAVLKVGISIEEKSFTGLQEDSKEPGIIVKNTEGISEFKPASYVFDCTGSRRFVVHAVNSLRSELPFKLQTITEIPIPKHFFLM